MEGIIFFILIIGGWGLPPVILRGWSILLM